MSGEGQGVDLKSLKLVTGRRADWDEMAKHCVAFANAQGGRLLIGIEDGEAEPLAGQKVQADPVEWAGQTGQVPYSGEKTRKALLGSRVKILTKMRRIPARCPISLVNRNGGDKFFN